MRGKAEELFNATVAESYDERFQKISPIRENLNFLIRLVLEDLPEDARILCIGVGTGIEIVELAKAYPQWRFTGVEPSAHMLDVYRSKLSKCGLMDRCDLVHGYVSDLPPGGAFDAVLCLLVTQFVTENAKRQEMFDSMAEQLKAGGYLINAEISGDMSSAKFHNMFEKWKGMHRLAGATAPEADNMINALKEYVAVAPPAVIERYLESSGFSEPVQFYQSLLIHAWYARKT